MYSPLNTLFQKIHSLGGYVNSHSHPDRANSISQSDFPANVEASLHEKWKIVEQYKQQTTTEQYMKNILQMLTTQAEYGAQACLGFIDCDSITQNKAMLAAKEAQKIFAGKSHLVFKIANQTLRGILSEKERYWFEYAMDYVDVIGSLPGADKGQENAHLDIVLSKAKLNQKLVHVHVDQLNSPAEKETELLCRRIIAHGMEGRVSAIHGISIATQTKAYRLELYKLARDAGLTFITCPSAWIDSKRTEELMPRHNAITPIDEMIPAGIKVAIGTDNIADIFKPFVKGDLETELRILLETTHYYNIEELVKICTTNGLSALGMNTFNQNDDYNIKFKE